MFMNTQRLCIEYESLPIKENPFVIDISYDKNSSIHISKRANPDKL